MLKGKLKKLKDNVTGVVIVSKGAIKHEIKPSGKTLYKKGVKYCKLKKKPLKSIRGSLGY